MIAIKSPVLLLLLFITFIFTSVSADLFGIAGQRTVWDVLTTDKRFSVLIGQIEENNLASTFKNLHSETLFAPTDKAFEDESSILKRKMTKEQILYHLIPISVKSNELWNGRLLDTKARLHDVPQVLKVTKTATELLVGVGGDQEQSKVGQANIETSNGVIHALDKVISLPTYLDETLYINHDTRDFYNKSETAHITNDLKSAIGNTIFVAKGDAFGDKLTPFERKYLLEHKEGRKDLARLLKHQIATKIFYSDDFPEGKSTIKTVEGSEDLEILVETHKLTAPTITVNGIKVVQSDLLAANGVVHVLESPLLPKNKNFLGLTARKALIGMNSSRFVELFDENGLGAYLDDQNDVTTVLAPPDDALDRISLPPSKELMESWLKYHIIHGRYDTSDLQDHQLLETESHDNLGDNKYQRLDIHVNDDHGFTKKSIRFGKSSILDDPVPIGRNLIIYPIANPLVLPRDPLSRLPVNLELSTFVASLYASEADESIARAHGITLFAPSNEAFSHLGLLAKYLLQPDAKEKLKKVVTYHAVQGVFYENSTSEGEHREITLSSGAEITLNKTKDGFFVRGVGAADGNDRNVIAKVVQSDILTSSGVIHTVDRVELPPSVKITNRNLLSVEGTNNFLNLLERTDLTKKVLDDLNSDKPYTLLAPSDRAFSKHNLSELLENHDKLLKIAKLHILPVALPRLDMGEVGNQFTFFANKEKQHDDDTPDDNIGFTGVDFPTLLSKDSYVVISKDVTGGYSVRLKGDLKADAKVTNLGRSTFNGGIIEIDNVLLPEDESAAHRLPWWAIVLIVLGVLLGLAILAVAAYFGWRWYQSRRDGRIALREENL